MGSLSKLVWLFQEHRDAVSEVTRLQHDLDLKNALIKELGERLDQAVRRQATSASDLLNQFRDEVLVDQPYPNGIIPENVWLTPGESIANES